jgi:hypothetical protein
MKHFLRSADVGRLNTIRRFRYLCYGLLCAVLSGCSANGAVNTPSPLPIAKVAATPIQGKATIIAVPAKAVGNIQPIYVSIANGTTSPMLESSGEIFALGADGNRVPTLPPQEAATQAGGSAGLASSVETATAYAAPAAAGGAATAAIGSAVSGGSLLSGSLIGSAVGLVIGAGTGLYQAHAAAETRAQEQVQNLSLKPTTIPPNGTESGYVFFPLREYQKVQAVLGDTEAGSAITIDGNITP